MTAWSRYHRLMIKNAFCSWCGTGFAQVESYPRVCVKCPRSTWDTPTPVVICVQPVRQGRKFGLPIAQRAIPPQIGGWALFSGHIEPRETVETAARREFSEETSGVAMGEMLTVLPTRANDSGHLLIPVLGSPIDLDAFLEGRPDHENLAFDVLWEPRDLIFPIHTDLVRRFFDRNLLQPV